MVDVTLYSRNGKVFENFPEIEEAIKQHSTKFMLGDGRWSQSASTPGAGW
jgi:hypothetical protein